ncbi:MAG: RNA-binding S4 domain-containing protein [Ruminococcaceae bacterium]|nr:RNA-binding S4 domain-containing protein [Oscillospiraceae bacterium]
MTHYTVQDEFIRLDDLLKLTGCVPTGGQAKRLIQGGEVWLDGEVCLLRGKKLRGGETVTIPTLQEEIKVDRP